MKLKGKNKILAIIRAKIIEKNGHVTFIDRKAEKIYKGMIEIATGRKGQIDAQVLVDVINDYEGDLE